MCGDRERVPRVGSRESASVLEVQHPGARVPRPVRPAGWNDALPVLQSSAGPAHAEQLATVRLQHRVGDNRDVRSGRHPRILQRAPHPSPAPLNEGAATVPSQPPS